MKKTTLPIIIVVILSLLFSSCSFSIPAIVQNVINNAENSITAQEISETTTESTNAVIETQTIQSPQIITLGDPQALQDAYNEIFDRISPSVVHIQVTSEVQITDLQIPGFPFSTPDSEQDQPQFQQSSGSGFVWNSDGMIITNNHVVQGADNIIVEFSDGLRTEAKIIGADPASDLAVIQVKVDKNYLKSVTLTDSTQVKTGDIAIAIGNPYGLQNTMTVGVVSALGRSLPLTSQRINGAAYSIPDVIQTDAPINPGNSGGVLVNLGGQVIGVTSAIESTSGANAGIGFVIPSIIVSKVVPSLIANGSYDHAWIGISGTTIRTEVADAMDLPDTQRGALVNEVIQGSPADLAGLRGSDKTETINHSDINIGGDIIIAIDDTPVNDFEDLVAYLARYTDVGQTVTLTIIRDGKEKQIDLTLASRDQHLVLTGEPWIGVQIMDVTADLAEAAGISKNTKGVLVVQITDGSPAEEAGLRGSYKAVEIDGTTFLVGGDIITAIDGKNVETSEDVKEIITDHQAGDEITLNILRDAEPMLLTLIIGAQ
ncbi:MAG: PDZ domain-containing protein [Anaerolineaceae bacterium]|nr:PDZ domain-containing protein [Anaerolineaceae bacterium]